MDFGRLTLEGVNRRAADLGYRVICDGDNEDGYIVSRLGEDDRPVFKSDSLMEVVLWLDDRDDGWQKP